MQRLNPSNIKFRVLSGGSPIWPALALLFFITTIIMTALFIWMVAKPSQQPMSAPKPPNPNIFELPCPRQPPLLELPNPLPQAIKDSLTHIDNHLKSLAKNVQNKSAISVNIFYRDKVIWRGHYGSKVYKGSNSPDDDTRYRIGSVTKIFPVILLYKLYQDGRITSLDDPLNKYAPNFHINNPFTGTNITLRQIAGQMSGLPREAMCGFSCTNTNSSEQLDFLKSQNLVIEPWTSPSYSNLGYALLGRLLTENLLNTTFEEWVEKQVLQPLGMKDTGFEITKKVLENMALPYGPDGKQLPFMNVGWAGPAGEMYSTSKDLMKLAKMFTTADGKGILKRETIRQILLPEYITRDGWWLWGSPWEMRFVKTGFVARQKGGNIDTYNAVLSVIPEMKMGLSVLMNNAPVFPAKGFSCFVIADLIHSTVLPALNKTLFEMRRHQSFPIDAKPFLGKYSVTQFMKSTGKVHNSTLNIKSNMDTLLATINHDIRDSIKGFVLKYIGKPLLLQGIASNAVNSTCVFPHLGVLCMVEFDVPGPDGLCPGFSSTIFDVLIVGKRIKSNDELPDPVIQKTSPWKEDAFAFDQPF